jgi:ABC-type phosphate/phosphonate transport system substrate-binding protein
MILHEASTRQRLPASILAACALAAFLALPGAAARAQQTKIDVLRIGTSGKMSTEKGTNEKAAIESLRSFIKDETGFENGIIRQKDWRELADKMAKKQLHLGVFQGYELAWAQEKYKDLKPLALAVNVYRYPVVYVVAKHDNPAKDFAGLAGQSLALLANGPRYVSLFVDQQSEAQGKKQETFFSKIVTPDNVEDALDDVVDGKVQAAAADRAALEAYKRRKPGRFKQLKEVAKSQPMPPPVVTFYDGVLEEATLKRFQDGLLRASRTDRGETMLTLFRLSGFETVPADFQNVLAASRKAYPPPDGQTK